eukprot:TRINITY_DN7537_c0_g1_i1.p1 TRINITY_DN7537_c0_g1~~TRINITY_DN7537_c0_g1_i1.p1  ORF type:complete len:377 (+),score=86.33 TRINITY_DN7537_c0_g1_i1:34-1164(+)
MVKPSRSSKKRWRKNDISDIEAALANERQIEDHLGTKPENLKNLPDKNLFKIDKSGSASIKKRTKEFYKSKTLSYQKALEPSHVLSPIVPQIQSTKPENLTMAERIYDKRLAHAEKRKEKEKALAINKDQSQDVYDIWNTPLGPEIPFYGKPKRQKATIRKPSALPAVAFPGSETSYNPMEEDLQKVSDTVKEKLAKLKEKEERLERIIYPTKMSTAEEIEKSLAKHKENLEKIKKKPQKNRRKGSKAHPGYADKNFSMKMSVTARNKQARRKAQLTIEKKNRMEKKRHERMDNAEQYAAAADEAQLQSKKKRELVLVRRKLEKFRTKNLRQRYLGVPSMALVRTAPAGSFRNLKPSGNEILERTARFEQRNMIVG